MNKLPTKHVFFSLSGLTGTAEDPHCRVSMSLGQLYCMNGPHTTQPIPTLNNDCIDNS